MNPADWSPGPPPADGCLYVVWLGGDCYAATQAPVFPGADCVAMYGHWPDTSIAARDVLAHARLPVHPSRAVGASRG